MKWDVILPSLGAILQSVKFYGSCFCVLSFYETSIAKDVSLVSHNKVAKRFNHQGSYITTYFCEGTQLADWCIQWVLDLMTGTIIMGMLCVDFQAPAKLLV